MPTNNEGVVDTSVPLYSVFCASQSNCLQHRVGGPGALVLEMWANPKWCSVIHWC
jgi:hypothetical protein